MPEDVIKAKIVFDTAGIEGAAKTVTTRAAGPGAPRPGGNGMPADVGDALGKIPGLGALTKIAGPMAAVAAGVGLMVAGIKAIQGSMKKMNKTLEESAPEYKATRELQKKMYNMALRPMASVMTILMKPYLVLQMLAIRRALKAARPTLAALKAGEVDPEEAIGIISEIFRAGMESVAYVQHEMRNMIDPILGDIAGFEKGLSIVYQNWLTGVKEWVSGFIDGINTETGGIPAELASTISEALLRDKIELEEIPKTIRIDYLAHMVKAEELDPFSKQIAGEVEKYLLANKDELEEVMTKIRTDLDQAALDNLKPDTMISNFVTNVGTFLGKVSDVFDREDLNTNIENLKLKIKGFFSSTGGFFGTIWNGIKRAARGLWGGIKATGGTFIGGIVGGIAGLFGDFISRPGQPVANFNPNDTIIGVKDPSRLFGGGRSPVNVTVNVNAIDGSSISPTVLSRISDAVQEGITRNMAGISSQSWGY